MKEMQGHATLVFPVHKAERWTYLARKQRGPGSRLVKQDGGIVQAWNGFGGFVEDGETVTEAAVRELYEEIHLAIHGEDLVQVAEVTFLVQGTDTHIVCDVFFVYDWDGYPHASEEMKHPRPWMLDALPFHEMLPGDRLWLPLLLRGETIQAEVEHRADFREVISFTWQPVDFL